MSVLDTALVFAPLLPWPVIAALALLGAGVGVFAILRGLRGGWLRLAALGALVLALADPALERAERTPLADIAVILVDESASQTIGARAAQTAEALAHLEREIARLGATETRIVRVPDAPGNGGTAAMAALEGALAEIPRARLAGVFAISDGQVHDADLAPALPAPFHLILTGTPEDWDRRLVITSAPGFAIIGEEVRVALRIEDAGAVPRDAEPDATLSVTIDDGAPIRLRVPVGQDIEVPLVLDHGGRNVVQIAIDPAPDEVTARNNAAVLQINGVRDRLRVLLVSGEPHAGQRVWRILLKSDAAVDLVQFTILRPPDKQDGVPVTELSLIAFPTRELFVEKIDEFDLIIFDRYRRRGILPDAYFENMRDYVRRGGAVLVAAGPEFGSAESIWRSPLAGILPAAPTARVIEGGFRPALTDAGQRHPVTAGLDRGAPAEGWGRWFRQIEVETEAGQVVMEGAEGRALLVLERVGEGRVAMLASDHIWLWGRGYEGGGPQLELLRRLAHWMMKEPELEEETLGAEAAGQDVTISRRTMGAAPGAVRITGPDRATAEVALSEVAPGLWQGRWAAPVPGLYRLAEGDIAAVAAFGPAAPREFAAPVASAEPLGSLIAATGGGVHRLSAGLPGIRRVAEGRQASGRGWLGLVPRKAHVTEAISRAALLPAWAMALGLAGLMVGAWLLEGRLIRRRG